MPSDPVEQTIWLLQRATAALQSAKMWPVKLSSIRHQESLSASLAYLSCAFRNFPFMVCRGKQMRAHAEELEKTYFQLGRFAEDPCEVCFLLFFFFSFIKLMCI